MRGSDTFSAPQVAAGAHQHISIPALGVDLSFADIDADVKFD